ncbi:MAG: acyltransferase, partial [Actinobacteria bacterium]|nr:acyltransferase [Actinomycetota bacterium]
MPKRPAISAVPYLPGLDGLRALAVLAVIAYHASPGRLPGGFLGVEVFFVVSGYLITLLLLAEHERTGRIGLKAFWARRARRLLPALYTLMVAVAVATATVPYLRSELAKLRHQLWWAFVYSTNWFQI